MATAVADAHSVDFAMLMPVGGSDLDQDTNNPKYNLGGMAFMNSRGGAKVMEYIQNRGTAFSQGQLISSVGDNNGMTQVTTSGAASVNTTLLFTTSGLTADAHVGGTAYVLNSLIGAGTPPEGEEAWVKGNTATLVTLDERLPYSATVTSGDTINIMGMGNCELSAIGDLVWTVKGVAVGKNGVSVGNYGWVQRQGRCPNTLVKASTALTQNDALIADTGRVGPAVGGTAAANLHVGSALNVVNSDIVSDKTTVILCLGFGFNPGTLDASA